MFTLRRSYGNDPEATVVPEYTAIVGRTPPGRKHTVEPVVNEVLGINDIFQPSNSVMYGKEPRYNKTSIYRLEPISRVPWYFVKSRFRCTFLRIQRIFFAIMRSARRLRIDSKELTFSLTSIILAHTKSPKCFSTGRIAARIKVLSEWIKTQIYLCKQEKKRQCLNYSTYGLHLQIMICTLGDKLHVKKVNES